MSETYKGFPCELSPVAEFVTKADHDAVVARLRSLEAERDEAVVNAEWAESERAELSTRLEVAEAQRDALRGAMTDILGHWYHERVLRDGDQTGVRPCPMKTVPKTSDVLRWAALLSSQEPS